MIFTSKSQNVMGDIETAAEGAQWRKLKPRI